MLPTRQEAERILKEAEMCNPGPWGNHSRVAAHCAEKIAEICDDMDADKAYILGLLHDIGRKFGGRHLGHVSDGYSYMMSLGYDEAARICLTHSFNNQTTDEYIGTFDTTKEELEMIQNTLRGVVMDEYDRLIQLCDALAGAEGVLDIEERMGDVKRRYGSYPQEKWNSNLALKKHFEEKTGKNIYAVVKKDSFRIFKFYGWQTAGNVKVQNNIYKGIETPLDLYDVLSTIWCADTCAPRLRTKWTQENRTLGQCSITAFLAQDIFGGEVYGMATGNGVHCYNVVDGYTFDLTSEQFGDEAGKLCYEGNEIQDRESAMHFAKEEKRQRYESLKAALNKRQTANSDID